MLPQRALKLVLLEDDPDDAFLLKRQLRRCQDLDSEVVTCETYSDARSHLAACDCVLLDLGLPDLRGDELLHAVIHEFPGLPIVVITGNNDTDYAQRTIQNGAQDYLVKGAFDERAIGHVVRYAVERHMLTTELRRLNAELADSLQHIETLRGMLPICAGCKKIRDSDDHWQDVASYISHHTPATFTHGMCPQCVESYYGEIDQMGTTHLSRSQTPAAD